MRSWKVVALAVVSSLVACAPTLVVQKTEEPSASSSGAEANAPRPSSGGSEEDDGPSLVVTYPLPPDVARVMILTDKHPARSAEVLAVFDFHTDADSEDKGFDQLRLAAARVGADAVIGAEFEHGEDGGKSHLSGMAVRFLDH
jgi:hypothetical protein